MEETAQKKVDQEHVEQGQPSVSWLRRHSRKLILLLALAIILGPYIFSRVTASSRLVQTFSDAGEGARQWIDESNEFTIAVMNIAHGRGQAESNWTESGQPKQERVQAIADMLKTIDADVVVLNEVDFNSTWSGHQNQAAAIAKAAGYSYRLEQRNLDFCFAYGSCVFGNAVLSRFPIGNGKYIEYPGVNKWEQFLCGKKGGAAVTIKCSPTSFFQLFPVHTEHRDEDIRVSSVEAILQSSSQVATILAGDFNSTPTGFPGSVQGTAGNALDKILNDGRFETRPQQTAADSEFTFSSVDPNKTIDWTFVSRHFEILEYRVVNSRPELSDHLPIVVRLKLNQ